MVAEEAAFLIFSEQFGPFLQYEEVWCSSQILVFIGVKK